MIAVTMKKSVVKSSEGTNEKKKGCSPNRRRVPAPLRRPKKHPSLKGYMTRSKAKLVQKEKEQHGDGDLERDGSN